MRGEYRKFVKNPELLTFNGVYRIYFSSNPNKSYIGSTTAKFRQRLCTHYNALKNNLHYNTYLQDSYNLYKEFLILEIVEVIENITELELRQIETEYIKKYDSYYNGFNLVEFPDTNKGFIMPDEILEKRRKKYLQYSLEGNFIREWNSLSEIIKQVGGFPKHNTTLTSNNFSAHGFMWRKKLSEDIPLKIEPYLCLLSKKVAKYDLEGNLLKVYDSISDARKEHNIPNGNITRAYNGKCKCYGFLWKLIKDDIVEEKIKPFIEKTGFQKSIKVYFQNGEIKKYKSIRDFCSIENINRSTITQKLKESNKFFHKKLNQTIKIEFYE